MWLTGRAEIIWDGPEVAAFTGAERLRRAPAPLPQRWRFAESCPFLRSTGVWRSQ